MKIKFPEGVTGASHDGTQYDPDEDGIVDIGEAPERTVRHFIGLGFEVVANEPLEPGEDDGTGVAADGDQDGSGKGSDGDSSGAGSAPEQEKATKTAGDNVAGRGAKKQARKGR